MPERKYSLAEIDAMRSALHTSIFNRTWGLSIEQIDRMVEDQIRTYMMNGTNPEEFENR